MKLNHGWLKMKITFHRRNDKKSFYRTRISFSIIFDKKFETYLTYYFRNGSDSGHGTKSSSSSRQDCDLPPLAYYTQTESPIIYHNSGSHLNPKDTLLSRKSSNNSVLFATSIQNPTLAHVPPSVQSNEHFHRNGIGEYAQIDIMPIDRTFQYTANRSEPIYESIEVANGNR